MRKYLLLIETATGKVVRTADVTDQSFRYIKCLMFGWHFDPSKYHLRNIG